MQIKTLGAIPVACALAGAIGGGIIAMRGPERFASSATVLLKSRNGAKPASPAAQEVRVSVQNVLGSASDGLKATKLLVRTDDSLTTVKLTYIDRDRAQAERVAKQLADVVAMRYGESAGPTEIVDGGGIATGPITRDYPTTVASGGGVGLVAGALMLLVLRSRRCQG